MKTLLTICLAAVLVAGCDQDELISQADAGVIESTAALLNGSGMQITTSKMVITIFSHPPIPFGVKATIFRYRSGDARIGWEGGEFLYQIGR